MTYKKVGGLRFVRVGRFGLSFFWSSKPSLAARRAAARAVREAERAEREAYYANLYPNDFYSDDTLTTRR